MIPHSNIINALRDLGFKYEDETKRIEIYKKAGTTLRVELRRRNLHDEGTVRGVLMRAGMSYEEAQKFISNYCTPNNESRH